MPIAACFTWSSLTARVSRLSSVATCMPSKFFRAWPARWLTTTWPLPSPNTMAAWSAFFRASSPSLASMASTQKLVIQAAVGKKEKWREPSVTHGRVFGPCVSSPTSTMSIDKRASGLSGQSACALHHRHGHAQSSPGLPRRSLAAPQAESLHRAHALGLRRTRLPGPRSADFQPLLSSDLDASQPQTLHYHHHQHSILRLGQ